MRPIGKYLLTSIATAILLAACGGNDPSSSTAVSAQEKAAAGTTSAGSYATVVQELYISYFGRPADPVGLTNFENRLLAAGAPTDIQSLNNAYSTNTAVKNLVNSFETSAESVSLYGNSTTTQFVTAIYQNVLGRAPDTAGLNYWANAISKGSLTQGNAALSIMAGAFANTTTQGMTDAKLISNRLTVAGYFTGQVSSQNATAGYAGNTAAVTARALLSSVDSDTETAKYQSVDDNIAASFATPVSGTITSIAGSPGGFSGIGIDDAVLSSYTSDNGLAIVGQLCGYSCPLGGAVAVDSSNNVYFTTGSGNLSGTYGNNVIRKVTPGGIITTVAGNGTGGDNGPAISASITPAGIAVDGSGNIYFADTKYNTIRKITATTGIITTIAGGGTSSSGSVGDNGPATSAVLKDPLGVAVDGSGNIYIGEYLGDRIRKVDTSGTITTIGGNGTSIGYSIINNTTATNVSLWAPTNITADASGNVYFSLASTENLYKISTNGIITTVTVGGTGTSMVNPGATTIDANGNIYVIDNNSGTGSAYIRKININNPSVITTYAGSTTIGNGSSIDGDNAAATSAAFYNPSGLAVDASGNLYVADTYDGRIRKIQH